MVTVYYLQTITYSLVRLSVDLCIDPSIILSENPYYPDSDLDAKIMQKNNKYAKNFS